MSWINLSLIVFFIYALYFGVQIALDIRRFGKGNPVVSKGTSFAVADTENKPSFVSDDIFDTNTELEEDIEISEESEKKKSSQTPEPEKKNEPVPVVNFYNEKGKEENLIIHPIKGQPIDLDEVRRSTNIISESIYS